MVKLSVLPAVIPAPHRLALLQVVVPPGAMVQPWLVSRLFALAGLYGNASFACCGDSHDVTGSLATGPVVRLP